ncbi:hypothetical protein ABIA85_007050 [Bradyrhizobium sp. LA6.10]|uniref:hypothetical protein n=1 Tax=Bradyrhizobium sp. LA6.10 TaxID=3156318 RepID=UPI0033985E8A
MAVDFYHLSGVTLDPGAVIKAGNWGRVIRQAGWTHNLAIREMALEEARLLRFTHRPSRLDSAFVFIDMIEARNFRLRIPGFQNHVLYRVSLLNPAAPSHITDTRLAGPIGTLRSDWADVYWMDFNPATISVPGIDNWSEATNGYVQEREMITTSDIRVEEVLP